MASRVARRSSRYDLSLCRPFASPYGGKTDDETFSSIAKNYLSDYPHTLRCFKRNLRVVMFQRALVCFVHILTSRLIIDLLS